MDLQDALNFDDLNGFESNGSTAYSSPAGLFDMNMVVGPNAFSTVSPQDLLRDFSAPNSSALTNLTSPSLYNDSPDFDGYEVSPSFDSSDLAAIGGGEQWFPLFPQDPAPVDSVPVDKSPSASSPEEAEPEKKPARKSGGSPSGHARHSSVSGVNAKRRDKPLPPIVVDDATDTVAIKRARNTLAARKSRERKAQKLEELEEKIEQLEQDRDYWKKRALGIVS